MSGFPSPQKKVCYKTRLCTMHLIEELGILLRTAEFFCLFYFWLSCWTIFRIPTPHCYKNYSLYFLKKPVFFSGILEENKRCSYPVCLRSTGALRCPPRRPCPWTGGRRRRGRCAPHARSRSGSRCRCRQRSSRSLRKFGKRIFLKKRKLIWHE